MLLNASFNCWHIELQSLQVMPFHIMHQLFGCIMGGMGATNPGVFGQYGFRFVGDKTETVET